MRPAQSSASEPATKIEEIHENELLIKQKRMKHQEISRKNTSSIDVQGVSRLGIRLETLAHGLRHVPAAVRYRSMEVPNANPRHLAILSRLSGHVRSNVTRNGPHPMRNAIDVMMYHSM